MLASMRKALKKGLLQFVVWFTFIAMILTYSMTGIIDFITSFFGLHNYAISVDGDGITREEFLQKESQARQRIDLIKKQFGPYAHMVMELNGLQTDPFRSALNETSQELFLDSIVKKYKIELDEHFAKQSLIRQLPKEVVDSEGNIDEHALRNLLKNMQFAEFEKKFEASLKRNVAVELINSAIFIPDFLINSTYQDTYSLKRYAILTFPINKYQDQVKKVQVSNQELKKYFHDHKNDYMIPEKRTVTLWKFPLSDYSISVNKKEIESLYNRNKSKYIETPAKVEVKRILLKFAGKNPFDLQKKAVQIKTELVQDPSKFSQLVKEHSDDTKSVEKDGSLGFVAKGDLEPTLEEAIFALEKDGQISEVIKTEEGLEILQRVSRKAPTYKSLSSVEAELKKELETKKFNALFNVEAKKVIKSAKKNSDALKELMQKRKGQEGALTLTKDDGSAITSKVFTLALGSYGFLVKDNIGYIFKLDDIEKSHLPKYKTIENKVSDDFYLNKAKSLISADIKKAQSANKPFKEAGEEYGATFSVTPFINSEKSSEIDELNKQGIPVENILNLHKKGNTKIFHGVDGSGYLVKVDDVETAVDDFAKKKALEKELFLETRNNIERAFIASLAKNAKIKVNMNEIKKTKRYNERI